MYKQHQSHYTSSDDQFIAIKNQYEKPKNQATIALDNLCREIENRTENMHASAISSKDIPAADIMELIIASKADFKDATIHDRPILHWLAYCGVCAQNVEFLLNNGANADHTDQFGSTALHCSFLNTSIQEEIRLEIITSLLNSMSITAVNTKFMDGQTALHYAASTNNLAATKAILDKGADVDPRDNNNCTPLHFGACYSEAKLIEVLLQHKAFVNAKSNQDATPLHLAAAGGKVEIAELLLSAGADTQAINIYGHKPSSYADQTSRLYKILEGNTSVKEDHYNTTALNTEIAQQPAIHGINNCAQYLCNSTNHAEHEHERQ